MRLISVAFSLILLLSVGCKESVKPKESEANITADNPKSAMNTVNWAGTYKGVLPCPIKLDYHCKSGISYDLTLHPNNTFSLTRAFVGKEDKAIDYEGALIWNMEGNTIELMADEVNKKFIIESGKLTLVDEMGRRYVDDQKKYELPKAR